MDLATEDDRLAADGATWIVDLDGVVWLAGEPIGEVATAVSTLRIAASVSSSPPTTPPLRPVSWWPDWAASGSRPPATTW